MIVVADRGWRLLAERAPALAAIAATISSTPQPLALSAPQKHAIDIRRRRFGRVRWAISDAIPTAARSCSTGPTPEKAPGAWDLGWYLALNRARLPQSKEDTIAAYRDALERHGIETAAWFDRQMALSLLGISACFGWEKAHGDEDELRWWSDRAEHAMRQLNG